MTFGGERTPPAGEIRRPGGSDAAGSDADGAGSGGVESGGIGARFGSIPLRLMCSQCVITSGCLAYDCFRLFTMTCSICVPSPVTATTHSPRARMTQRAPPPLTPPPPTAFDADGAASVTVIVPSTTHDAEMLFVVWNDCSNGGVRCAPWTHVLVSTNSTRLFPRIARRSAHGM